MPAITFFRQKRKDGGIRTGVDVGMDTVLSHFEAGAPDSDPSIVWYVDVRAEGAGVPSTPDSAQEWFAGHAGRIQRLLHEAASDFPAGVDPGDTPITRTATVNGPGQRKAKLSVVAAVV